MAEGHRQGAHRRTPGRRNHILGRIEPFYLRTTRAAYDTVAVDYAELVSAKLAANPLDRGLLAAFGVVLSPGLVAVAGRAHPGVQFYEGSITALDLVDGGRRGILAWYTRRCYASRTGLGKEETQQAYLLAREPLESELSIAGPLDNGAMS